MKINVQKEQNKQNKQVETPEELPNTGQAEDKQAGLMFGIGALFTGLGAVSYTHLTLPTTPYV